MHDRDRSQAAAEPGRDHAPECPADRRAGQQQPKADAAQPQPLLGQQHQDRALGGGDDVEPGVPQGQRPQHPMREQPAQPLGDLRPQAGAAARPPGMLRRGWRGGRGWRRSAPSWPRTRPRRRRRGSRATPRRGTRRPVGRRAARRPSGCRPAGRWPAPAAPGRGRPGPGMSVWEAVSTRVWPVPSRNPVAISSGMLAQPASTAAAKLPTTTRRAASTIHMTRRRSQRSSSAPQPEQQPATRRT